MHSDYGYPSHVDKRAAPPQYMPTVQTGPPMTAVSGGEWGVAGVPASTPGAPAYYAPSPMHAQQFGFPGAAMVADPLVQNMAVQYGQSVLGQGRQAVVSSVGKYVSLSRLKYYFSVDTTYVTRKLRLLFLPFANSDWSIRFNSQEPIQPRHEVNAPDLYIPVMAFVTYILVAGFLLGRQQRFSPELLGIQFSSALAWLVFEVLVVLLSIYVLNTDTSLKTLDIVAFSGYKYVCVNAVLLSSLFLGRTGFMCVMAYCCSMCSLFLARTLKVQLQPAHESGGAHATGVKRRMYVLLLMSGVQPPLIYWLSHHLVDFESALNNNV